MCNSTALPLTYQSTLKVDKYHFPPLLYCPSSTNLTCYSVALPHTYDICIYTPHTHTHLTCYSIAHPLSLVLSPFHNVCTHVYGDICSCTCMYVYVHVCNECSCMQYVYTGWRRLIGSPKMQIIFLKRASKYRSLWRKITYKDKGSYESSPPCSAISLHVHVHTAYVAYIYRIHVHMSLHVHVHTANSAYIYHIHACDKCSCKYMYIEYLLLFLKYVSMNCTTYFHVLCVPACMFPITLPIQTHSHTQYRQLTTRIIYGVALVSRIDKIIGLFCKRAL